MERRAKALSNERSTKLTTVRRLSGRGRKPRRPAVQREAIMLRPGRPQPAIPPDGRPQSMPRARRAAAAAQVAKLLMNSGFVRVRPLLGGLEAWIAAGHPVESLVAGGGVESSP